MSHQTKDKKVSISDKNWWQPALLSFGRMSAWVAAPVLIGAFIGSWLDRRQGTEPWMFLGSVGVAFFISITGLVIETSREINKASKDEQIKEEENTSEELKIKN